MKTCPYCPRPLAGGDICPAHGYVGPPSSQQAVVPSGIIVMWSGAATAVPTSWALCDGTNGTPDLREKFILCAGNTTAVGTTGGSNAAHAHSNPSTGGASTADAYNHASSGGGTTSEDGDHDHGLAGISSGAPSATVSKNNGSGASYDTPTSDHTHSITLGAHVSPEHSHSVPSHTHTAHADHSHAQGNTGAASGVPAHYALAFIMKL